MTVYTAFLGTLFILLAAGTAVTIAMTVRARRLRGRLLGMALVLAAAFLLVLFTNFDATIEVDRRAAEPAARIDALKLVDLNVLHGFPRFRDQELRYERLLRALEALGPDVVVLQEAWSVSGHGELAERLGRDLGFDAAYARANGSRRLLGFEEGSAVLSRLPIVEAKRRVLAPRWPLWESRIALLTRVRTGPGETLDVVTTHLTHRHPDLAHRQATDLLSKLPAEGSLVVAGDLNATSRHATVRAFTERGFKDVLPGGIDHLLVRGLRVREAAWTLRPRELEALIGERVEISDHPGIVAVVDL